MTEKFDVLFLSLNSHNKIPKVNIYDPTFINEEAGSGRLWQMPSGQIEGNIIQSIRK